MTGSLLDTSMDPLASAAPYHIAGVENVLTPALAIYPELVDSNLDATLRLLDGNAGRWRPHVKTAKLGFVMRRYAEKGVRHTKCSTTVEVAAACDAGMTDVLLAYPVVGANARRMRDLVRGRPQVRFSVLVENASQLAAWDASVGIFIDVNPGMDRTGIEQEHVAEIVNLAAAIGRSGHEFRGLHYYDGHLGGLAMDERTRIAQQGYARLMGIVEALEGTGHRVEEVITSGTPAFPCSLSYAPFTGASFTHRVSPGTVVYSDLTSLAQLPREYGYRPAALVLATVVSHPRPAWLTCDAGHKAVSADAGVPTCAVAGRPDLEPLKPSEEHLPIKAPSNEARPAIGETLYLVARHVCPTVNNFDQALIVSGNRVAGVEKVTARGHEAPLAAG